MHYSLGINYHFALYTRSSFYPRFLSLTSAVSFFLFFSFFIYNWAFLWCMDNYLLSLIVVVQPLNCVRLSVTPWTAAHQNSLSITISQSLLKLMFIESVMPSNHLILCYPLLLLPSIFTRIKLFSNMSVLHIWWPKYCSFSFSISPSHEYSGLTSFRVGLVGYPCSPRDSQESSPTPQFNSINSSVLSFLYSPTLTSILDYWKNHSFD